MKILKNTTVSPINVVDTGVTIPASPGSYTIPPQDYLIWAASSNVVTFIGSGDLVVNDGSSDLDINQGTDLILGIFPSIVYSQGTTTSGSNGILEMGAVTTSAPTYTTGLMEPISLTTTGLLRVDASGSTIPISGTVTANQGTSPWVVSGTVAATQSGTWNTGTLSTITNPVTVAQATAANLNATVVGTGTFAVQAAQSGTWTTGRTWTLSSGTDSVAAVQSGTWNINNISGTISLPTGAATEATLATLSLSQGSTTSGEKGPLVQGAVTTAAPSYTTAQTSPLSLTTAGALRVDASGTTQPISGTVTANQGGAPWSVNQTQWNGVAVSVGNGVSGTGVVRVAIASDNTAFSVNAIQSGTWNIGTVTTVTTVSTVSTVTAVTAITNALPSGTNTIGKVSSKIALSPASPTAATVGTSSASAVASNASRTGLVLTNTSVNIIYLGLGATAVVGSGITLAPYGVWTMDEYTFNTGAINAIASAASSNLAIQEFS